MHGKGEGEGEPGWGALVGEAGRAEGGEGKGQGSDVAPVVVQCVLRRWSGAGNECEWVPGHCRTGSGKGSGCAPSRGRRQAGRGTQVVCLRCTRGGGADSAGRGRSSR